MKLFFLQAGYKTCSEGIQPRGHEFSKIEKVSSIIGLRIERSNFIVREIHISVDSAYALEALENQHGYTQSTSKISSHEDNVFKILLVFGFLQFWILSFGLDEKKLAVRVETKASRNDFHSFESIDVGWGGTTPGSPAYI